MNGVRTANNTTPGEALAVHQLRKSYGPSEVAVNDISFSAEPGEFIVLLGPSGCGKTTTLRCIAGFEAIDAGEIRIGASLMAGPGVHRRPERRNIGMVFQSYAVWPHMSVAKNVLFPLQARKIDRSEFSARLSAALTLVELENYADRPASELSGGQQQRVALARALVYSPGVLLLDEPLSNLDAELRNSLRFELKALQQRTGITAVHVTHDQSEAVVLGDKVAVMQGGRLVQFGTPEEIYERPAEVFVASFTGVENLLTGVAERRDNGVCEVHLSGQGGHSVIAHAAASTLPSKGRTRELVVSVRAENVRLTAADGVEAPTRQNVWQAQVRSAEYLGLQTRYELDAGGLRLYAREIGTAMRFPPGTLVHADLESVVPPYAISPASVTTKQSESKATEEGTE